MKNKRRKNKDGQPAVEKRAASALPDYLQHVAHSDRFRSFHAEFYKSLREYYIGDGSLNNIFSNKIFTTAKIEQIENKIKSASGSKVKLDLNEKRKFLYPEILESYINIFCCSYIAPYLQEKHKLCLDPDQFGHGLPFRGLFYVHSEEIEEKVKRVNFGQWESEEEDVRTSEVFNLRYSVSHLLGEAIWRFFVPGETKIPCIFFDPDYEVNLNGSTLTIPIPAAQFSLEGTVLPKEDWPSNFYEFLSKNPWWNENQNNIFSKVKKIISKWVADHKDYYLIDSIREEYNDDDLKKLFANPIYHRVKNKVKNICYIPDIHRNKSTGGLVCELSLEVTDKKRKITSHEFKQLISDIQWIISDYIIAPISSCENEFSTGTEKTYVEKFYVSLDTFCDFKGGLITQLKDKSDKTKAHVEALTYFFESVSPKRGSAIRGYKRISEKAFITICRLWNSLEVYNIAGGGPISEKDLSAIENDVTNFGRKNIRYYQPALELLYLALDFEDTLKDVPSYREHFVHSFHVYCFGLWIFLHPEAYKNCDRKDSIIYQQWFLASLWHDISYALQKLPDISNIFIQKLIPHGYAKDKEEKSKLVPIVPSWGYLLLVKDFYKLLLGEPIFKEALKKAFGDHNEDTVIKYLKKVGIETAIITELTDTTARNNLLNDSLYDAISSKMLKLMLDKADHAILSGLILYHQLCNANVDMMKSRAKKESTGDGANNVQEHFGDSFKPDNHERLIEVIVAIMMHSAYDWFRHEEQPTLINGWKIKEQDVPIAHLLVLCDILVQSGRDFGEMDTNISDMDITYQALQNDFKGKICLEYKYVFDQPSWNSETLEEKAKLICDKFYKIPGKILQDFAAFEVEAKVYVSNGQSLGKPDGAHFGTRRSS